MASTQTMNGMPRKEAKAKLTKEIKTIYIDKRINRILGKAAKDEGLSQSVYIEQMLRIRFKKEGLI